MACADRHYESIESQDATVGGEPSTLVTIEVDSGLEPTFRVRGTVAHVLAEGTSYAIWYEAPADHYIGYLDEFEAVLESFEFLG
jgi:hypothetical protein